MHKAESILLNRILWNFEIQTDYLIPTGRQDLVLINNKKRRCHLVGFAVPTGYRVKIKENKKIDKYMNLARELKKAVDHESDGDDN